MKNILVSAYGCEPFKGSESGVGWNWVLQMAKKNKIYVITRANNRQIIESNIPQEVSKNLQFFYYDTPNYIKRMKNKAKGLYFYYFCWQIGIIPLVKHILKNEKIDYTMHLSFGSMWMPTFLPLFRTPFIWGPIGGADCEPISFLKLLSLKQRIIQTMRYIMDLTTIVNPFIFIPSFRAKKILCRTDQTANAIPFLFKKKTKVILETAMESDIFDNKKLEGYKETLNFITTGRLMPSKNLVTAIRSLKYLPNHIKYHYTIIGSGPEEIVIRKEIKNNNLESKVSIINEIPRKEVLNYLINSDIFLFPSLREGGSWALMEAMAIGLPVICLDWAGMKITTDDCCAIRLPVTDSQQMARDMAQGIIKLVNNPMLRKEMGQAGRKRIKEMFNWESKGEFMQNLLKELENE